MRVDDPKPHRVNLAINESSPKSAKNFAYFADCLDYNLHFSGHYSITPFANHLTEIDFMIFLLDFRIKSKAKIEFINYTYSHITYIIQSHPLFDISDEYQKKYFTNLGGRISAVLEIQSEGISKLIDAKKILTEIREEISANYIKNVVDWIHVTIQCAKHKPETHIKTFDYLAKITFAYFYSTGYSKNDISSFCDKLLKGKNSLIRQNNKIYVESPVPKNLLIKIINHNKTNSEFNKPLYNEIKNYLENRSLKEQIEGFFNLSQLPKHRYNFLFKIENLAIKDDFFDFEDIRIYRHDYFNSRFKDKICDNNFFSKNKYSVSYVHIRWTGYSQNQAVSEAIPHLNKIINKLCLHLNSFFQLNTLSYIPGYSEDFNYPTFFENLVSNRVVMYPHEIKDLVVYDNKLKLSENQDFLSKIDDIISSAHADKNIHSSLSKYWKVCDLITYGTDKSCLPKTKLSPDVKIMGLLASMFEKEVSRFYHELWGYNIISNNQNETIEGNTEAVNFFQNRSKNISFPGVSRLYRWSNHGHLKYRMRRVIKYSDETKYNKVVNHYNRLFLGLWAYRNSHEHFNEKDELFARNIKHFMHHVIYNIRTELWRIMLNSTKFQTKNEIIDKLIKESIQKLKDD